MRKIGIGLLLAAVFLCACSTTGSGSAATVPGSSNVTPCNYAQAWHDNPTQFSEYGTLATFAAKATDSHLRDEARQLASAIASHDAAALGQVMGSVFTTCQQLGLVRTRSAAPPTTG
jgi:hypothetical protein